MITNTEIKKLIDSDIRTISSKYGIKKEKVSAILDYILDNIVKSDWNSEEGYSQILNKPDMLSPTEIKNLFLNGEGESLTEFQQPTLVDGVINFFYKDEKGEINEVNLNINSFKSVFSEDLVVSLKSGAFGKYVNGDTIPSKGKTPEEVIKDAISQTQIPTLEVPSASLSIDTTTREVGSPYSLSATVNFNRGSIKGKLVNGIWEQNTEQNKRAGEATKYIINGVDKGLVNSNTVSGVVALGTNSFSGSVTYAQGPQPTDSSGSNYSSPLAAGTLNVSSSFTGMYKIFWGAAASNITDYRSLPDNKLNNSGTSVNLVTGTTYKDFYLAIPANRSLSKVIDTGALNADITNSFVQSSVNVNDAGGNPVAYKLYKMSNADTYDVSHSFTITIV